MYQHSKKIFTFILYLLWLYCAKADTKTLRCFSVSLKKTLRDETIYLDEDGYIVVEGQIVKKYLLPNDASHEQKLNSVFIADKYGYRARYSVVKEEFVDIERLSASSLKSLAG